MAIPVHIHIEATICNSQASINDIIFCKKIIDHRGMLSINSPLDDPDHRNPDFTRHIFRNTEAHVFAVHPNNLVVPVRFKREYTEHHNSMRLKEALNINNHKGIYIVDQHTIYDDFTGGVEKLMKYYYTGCNVDFIASEKEKLLNTILSTDGRFGYGKLMLRFITFIPEDVLDDKGYVFSPITGIAFTNCELSKDFVHPYSPKYKENAYAAITDYKNVIAIDIINNEKDTPYYYKAGRDVVRVMSSRDNSRPSGVVITIKKNGGHPKKFKSALKDSGKLGVFRTEEEALTEGNIALLNEKNKLEYEKEKLNGEIIMLRMKLESEKTITENKLKMSQLDMSSKRLGFEFEKYKNLTTLSQANIKFCMEIAHTKEKNQLELVKLSTDTVVKIVTAINSLFKLFK